MRKKILIYIGRVLAIAIVMILLFVITFFALVYKDKDFWETLYDGDMQRLEKLIHIEGYSPDTKVPFFNISSIKMLIGASDEDSEEENATIEYLLKQGADPNNINKKGYTNLTLAIIRKRPKLAKILIDYGANVNTLMGYYGSGTFVAAVNLKQYDLAQYLLDHGAYANKKLYEDFKKLKKNNDSINKL